MQKLIGKFNKSNLSIISVVLSFQPSDEFRILIERKWDELQNFVKKSNGHLWNGLVYRLNKISQHDGQYELHLSTIDFKTHYATAYAIDELKLLPFEDRPNGIYISAYILTSDDKLVFGLKSDNSIVQSSINFIGGNLNKDEMQISSIQDLFEYYLKELNEELSLENKDVLSIDGLGIYESVNCRIGIILVCKLNINSEELKTKSLLNFENKSLLFCDKESLLQTLDMNAINPNILGTYSDFLKA